VFNFSPKFAAEIYFLIMSQLIISLKSLWVSFDLLYF